MFQIAWGKAEKQKIEKKLLKDLMKIHSSLALAGHIVFRTLLLLYNIQTFSKIVFASYLRQEGN